MNQDMTIVTVREFRANIKKFLDLAESGEKVVIRRGAAQFYMMPVQSADLAFSQGMQEKVDAANRQITDLVNGEDDDPRVEDAIQKCCFPHCVWRPFGCGFEDNRQACPYIQRYVASKLFIDRIALDRKDPVLCLQK